MPSGANSSSCITWPSLRPVTASTILPAQSMPIPYCQRAPGSNSSGGRQRLVEAGADGRHVHDLAILQDLRVPDVVAEARRVRQQMAQGDVPCGLAQARLAGGVEALQHLHVAEIGDHFFCGRIEFQRTALDLLQWPPRRSPPWSWTRARRRCRASCRHPGPGSPCRSRPRRACRSRPWRRRRRPGTSPRCTALAQNRVDACLHDVAPARPTVSSAKA